MTASSLRVQEFHARQMRALDDHRYAEFAATFTADGVFHPAPGAPVLRTPAGIAEGLARLPTAEPLRRRRWLGQPALSTGPEGELLAIASAFVVTVWPNGDQRIGPSCLVRDELVLDGDSILVRSRVVDHDDR